ncbi:glycosyltransferase family 9 protein [Gloeocapsa sp. PCC 73106]|uniref:glycosyltransferase family 9 protein n=1 Tax=Gloeocapsa sp. PCC 73106 TaxID=102232 RepID=UPI0002AC750C|nr:glycosyltransferase family 9 protein [Gloeocapsa sp. PCC 73106]ELR99040.1 ADP-heptose:LPS heptosyltransferase [Gloeocapsa sp. PCC 73106]
MRILTLVPGGIGDQILFFPTLKDLKTQFPKALIDVIVEPRAKAAYRVCADVNEVLTFDYKDRNSMADYLNLLGVIRDREYDAALTLGQRWTVGLLLWLNGIPTRVGYRSPNAWFISHPVPLKTEQYAAHMYHDLLQGLGIKKPCPPVSIDIPAQDLDWAQGEKQRLELQTDGYILIHGGSSQLAQVKGIDKIYPAIKWQIVIQDIQRQKPELPIVLIKGPEDGVWSEQMLKTCSNLKVTSPPDLGKLAAMIKDARLMLCTDSAPMHLAIALLTPTIALFGPTSATKLIPPQNDQVIGIQSPTKAIADIVPETILAKISNV